MKNASVNIILHLLAVANALAGIEPAALPFRCNALSN